MQVEAIAASVADEAEANALVEQAHEAFGRLDAVVNNAGITRDGLMVRMKDDDFDRVIDVNLKGTFHICRAAGKIMMKQRYGRIVNMSSISGVGGNAGQANYAASKAGVIGLTKTIARELAARGVTANAVAPGFHLHRHDRRAVREAARGHRRADPHEALRHGGRCRSFGGLFGKRGIRIHYRAGHLHRWRFGTMSQVIEMSATRRPDGTHRVVITGMGAVTPAGVGVDALWDAVMGKRCCIDTISHFDHEAFDVHVAGEVRDFDPTEHGLSKRRRAASALRPVRHRGRRRGHGPVRHRHGTGRPYARSRHLRCGHRRHRRAAKRLLHAAR